MELLNTIKPYLFTILVTAIMAVTAVNIMQQDPGQSQSDHLQQRVAARDSLVMARLESVLIKMDSIDARAQRIEALQERIPEMEAAIQLNLRSAEDLTPAERSELRSEIIQFLTQQP